MVCVWFVTLCKFRGCMESDIPALCGLTQKLKFLGIFSCDSASFYENIPAFEVNILILIDNFLSRFFTGRW